MIVIATLICCISWSVEATVSGFYVDNGMDQSVMHRMMSPSDAQEVEHEILEMLGLPDRPRKKHIHPSMRYEIGFVRLSNVFFFVKNITISFLLKLIPLK